MELVVTRLAQATVVSVLGSLDALTAEELESCLQSQLDGGQTRLVLELGQMNYMGSVGLRVILSIVRNSREKGGDVRLAAPQPGVENVLRVAGVTGIVRTFPTAAEAVASYSA